MNHFTVMVTTGRAGDPQFLGAQVKLRGAPSPRDVRLVDSAQDAFKFRDLEAAESAAMKARKALGKTAGRKKVYIAVHRLERTVVWGIGKQAGGAF